MTSPTPRPAEVPEILQFTATTADGGSFDGTSLIGRPVLVWFCAPWCPTRRAQIPQVCQIAADYGDQVAVLGVGSLDDAEAIRGLAADTGDITQLVDENGSVWRHFEVVEQSSFVLLNRNGAEVFRAGYGGADDLADRVADTVS